MEGWRLRKSVEEDLVGMAMLECKLQIALAGLRERSGMAERREEFSAGPHAYGAKNIIAVAVTLVEGRSGGAGGLATPRMVRGFFASARPQPAGHVEDALFELRICLSGQRPRLRTAEITAWPDCFDDV